MLSLSLFFGLKLLKEYLGFGFAPNSARNPSFEIHVAYHKTNVMYIIQLSRDNHIHLI
jgi:hypothetical protein